MVALMAPQTWVKVRCPHCRTVLGEIDGAARLRKVCPDCRPRIAVVYDHRVQSYEVEPVTATGTALTLTSLATA